MAEHVGKALSRAERATEQGRRDDAISLYRQILSDQPENRMARNNLGCLLLEIDRVDEAVDILRSDPEDAPERDEEQTLELRRNLGYALLKKGDFHRAERVLRSILAEEPDAGVARNHLGMVLLRRGRISEAIEELRRVVREFPRMVEGWNNLGCALYRAADLDGARQAFDRALQTDPYGVDAHNNLGCVLRDLGLVKEATEELQLAVQLEPRNAAIHLNLALCHHLLGRSRDALSHMQRFLRYDDRNGEIQEIHRLFRTLEKNAVGNPTKESKE